MVVRLSNLCRRFLNSIAISYETSDMVDNHKRISEYPNNPSRLKRNVEVGVFKKPSSLVRVKWVKI